MSASDFFDGYEAAAASYKETHAATLRKIRDLALIAAFIVIVGTMGLTWVFLNVLVTCR